MKINSKVLSIPPFISTSWENVASLHMDENNSLVIALKMSGKVVIPNLPGSVLNEVFVAHSDFLEHQNSHKFIPNNGGNTLSIGVLPSNLSDMGMENFSGLMQHDPSQQNAPPLPQEILSRISSVAKALGLDFGAFQLPPGEPHCNCPYCQIAKSMSDDNNIKKDQDKELSANEEPVTDADLAFREWDIKQAGEKLYQVSNPFNSSEQYQVYLGHPVGCTCGKNNCEHILAVLNS